VRRSLARDRELEPVYRTPRADSQEPVGAFSCPAATPPKPLPPIDSPATRPESQRPTPRNIRLTRPSFARGSPVNRPVLLWHAALVSPIDFIVLRKLLTEGPRKAVQPWKQHRGADIHSLGIASPGPLGVLTAARPRPTATSTHTSRSRRHIAGSLKK
jgi:hypothetical protein